jgi:hypothetical protein
MLTYDEEGYVEPGSISIQIKAAETLAQAGRDYVFDLDVRDYNLWMMEPMPVFLILFDASRRRAYWLDVQGYFLKDIRRRPKKRAKTVRVRVPRRQAVSRRAIRQMRAAKQEALAELERLVKHV